MGRRDWRRAAATGAILASVALAQPAAAEFVQDSGSPLPVGLGPYGVAATDMDGNGMPDLAAASANAGTVTVLLRQLNGSWQPDPATPRSSSGANAVAIGDLDGDGRPDLAVARNPSGAADVFIRQANGTFSNPAIAIPVPGATSVKVARVNGDARPDIVFGTTTTDSVYVVLRNAVNTGFEAPVQHASVGHKADLEVADFTGDGRVDIVASNDTHPSVDLWVQQPNGTFALGNGFPLAIGTRPLGLASADFNADGRLDLAVALPSIDKVALLLGQLGGGFVPMGGSPFDVADTPVGVAAADFNRDGAPDLAVANQGGKSISVLLRTPTGFANDPSSPIATGQSATEIATADFNLDGKTDFAVANSLSNTVSVVINATPDPTPLPGDGGGGGSTPGGGAPAPAVADRDGDGVPDTTDRCPDASDPVQADADGDGIGDACEALPSGALAPVAGVRVATSQVEGEVLVRLTPNSAPVLLAGVASLPVGAVVDARKGRLVLRTAGRRGRSQSARIAAGIFQIKQKRARRGRAATTDLVLRTPPGSERACAAAGAPRKGVVRRLTVAAKGVFRTVGAAAPAKGSSGATWSIADRCDGTLTRAIRGRISVRAGGRTVVVRPGKSYLARARLFGAKVRRQGGR